MLLQLLERQAAGIERRCAQHLPLRRRLHRRKERFLRSVFWSAVFWSRRSFTSCYAGDELPLLAAPVHKHN